MHQLLRFLALFAAIYGSIGQASATSIYPVDLTGGPEEFILSYSSDQAFTLKDLSLKLGKTPSGATNVLAGISGSLQQFTGSSGQLLQAGTGTFTEIISAPAGNYTFAFSAGAASIDATVSPVPLPASSLLFMMALAGFGLVGFISTRQTKLVSA